MTGRGARYSAIGMGERWIDVTCTRGGSRRETTALCGTIDVAVLKWCLILESLLCFGARVLGPHYIVLSALSVVNYKIDSFI